MFFRTEEKRIGGYCYRVTQLDVITGIEVLARFMNTVGPSLGSLEKLDEAGVVKALGSLATTLKADDVRYFMTKFAKLTAVSEGDIKDGNEPQLSDILEAHFAGRYLDLFKWLAFCFEVNYRSFFVGKDGLAGLVRKVQQEYGSSSPKASSPGRASSGDS